MRIRTLLLWLIIGAGAVAVGSASAQLETEPNDAPSNGTPMTLGTSAGDIGAGDVDYWVHNATAEGWARVEMTAGSGLTFSVGSAAGLPATLSTQSANVRIFRLLTGQLTWVLFESAGGTGAYSFTFASATNASMFSDGEGEYEPNDYAADATTLAGEDTFAAAVDKGIDTTDYFRIVGHKGDMINIWVQEAPSETGQISLSRVSGFPAGAGTAGYDLSVLLATEADLVFKVTTLDWTVNYTVDVSIDHTNVYADGKVTLSEAYTDPVIDALITPAKTPTNIPAGGVTLATGSGYMFGETLCISSGLSVAVLNLTVEIGQRLDPADKDLQTMVTSNSVNLTIPAGDEVCFHAISYNETGDLGYSFASYKPGPFLTGDAMAVMRAIDNRSSDNAGAQLALWSVTDGTTESRARQWDATAATISEAKQILEAAGVHNQLNPAGTTAPPATGGTGGTGGTGSTTAAPNNTLAYVGGGIFLLLLILGIVGAVASKKRRAAAGTMPLPGQPYTGAGGPGYLQQYGAAPLMAPPYGGAYGAPASPYGAPPPAYQPQGVPVYAPVRTYQPLPPLGPVPPYVPTAPPPPPAAPAAPREASVPCPTCSSPVGYYAPKCAKCGMELSWT